MFDNTGLLLLLTFLFTQSDRLNHVLDLLNTLNSLCLVLGIDFKQTVTEVHPSLGNNSEGTKNMSNETIERLTVAIQRLREVKLQRMQRVIHRTNISFQFLENYLLS